jgi:hypothetical protein
MRRWTQSMEWISGKSDEKLNTKDFVHTFLIETELY